MEMYDSGAACFEANENSARIGKDYVEVLEDILVPDYGELETPVIIFSGTGKKRSDNHGNNTYVRDGDGFLIVNFKHITPRAVVQWIPMLFLTSAVRFFFRRTICICLDLNGMWFCGKKKIEKKTRRRQRPLYYHKHCQRRGFGERYISESRCRARFDWCNCPQRHGQCISYANIQKILGIQCGP